MLTDTTRGAKDEALGLSVPIEIKDILLIAVMAGAPVLICGHADSGKTQLAILVLNALLGSGNFQMIEINRGMNIDELIDIDVAKLKEASLRKAISEAPWLEKPGKLVDELNRAPAQLINLLQHVIDGKGATYHGVSLKVGYPYVVDQDKRRYNMVIATMNSANTAQEKKKYKGVFEMDYALLRRFVIPISFDLYPPTHQDVARLMDESAPHILLRSFESLLPVVIQINESLRRLVPFGAFARLFRAYVAGMSNCIRARNGRFDPDLNKALCADCRLHTATPYCGRVSAPAPGRLIWMSEIARALAVVRAVKIFRRVERDCASGDIRRVQAFTDSTHKGPTLFREFQQLYLKSFQLTADDLVASYALLCPTHVWLHDSLLRDAKFEGREEYVLADVAKTMLARLKEHVARHRELLSALDSDNQLTPAQESELGQLIENEDCAMINVIAMLVHRHDSPSFALSPRVAT
jgi:MoxR-like ATPase